MKTIRVKELVGTFAEDKDKAQEIRLKELAPELAKLRKVTIDFKGVTGATQSFVHAMVSDLIRSSNGNALSSLRFKNCNQAVKRIISIVAEYSQASAD